MSKEPETSAPLFELIRNRWSPRSFEDSHLISDHELLSILESARWSPSANNGQPWRFSVAKRGSVLHSKIVETLISFNQHWAPDASVLFVLSIKRSKDGTSSKRNFYDAGLAVSLMTIQAQSLGLFVHQMSGFNIEKMEEVLHTPDDLEAAVVIAIGKKDRPDKFEGEALEREMAPRTRLSLDQIVLHNLPVV